MQFDNDPCTIKDYIKQQLSNQLINQLTLYFHDTKERMRVEAKHQLVIESAAPYCCKLTKRKSPNTTIKTKRKSYMNAPNFHKICCSFHRAMGTNHFLQSIQHTEKKNTNIHRKKIPKNIPPQTDYKNHDISILQINQIIFYLSHVTILRNFLLSHAGNCLITRKQDQLLHHTIANMNIQLWFGNNNTVAIRLLTQEVLHFCKKPRLRGHFLCSVNY